MTMEQREGKIFNLKPETVLHRLLLLQRNQFQARQIRAVNPNPSARPAFNIGIQFNTNLQKKESWQSHLRACLDSAHRLPIGDNRSHSMDEICPRSTDGADHCTHPSKEENQVERRQIEAGSR